jgi:hypothetical protein
MTGRGMGYCGGYGRPGYAGPFPGRRFGRGWGRGRGGFGGGGWGWRHGYRATGLPGWMRFGYAPAWDEPPIAYGRSVPTPEEEMKILREQADWLKEQLENIHKRIDELQDEE